MAEHDFGCGLSTLGIQKCSKLSKNANDKSCSSKGKCALEGTFFANRFPSLGNFAYKKVGFRKN